MGRFSFIVLSFTRHLYREYKGENATHNPLTLRRAKMDNVAVNGERPGVAGGLLY
ncbi:hypothetical protein LX36DRAFT_661908 [Colletotrichum falcatum]|nr:hypothetical protein LX36DRAFT_661908 [Colletotrichum falcatum]